MKNADRLREIADMFHSSKGMMHVVVINDLRRIADALDELPKIVGRMSNEDHDRLANAIGTWNRRHDEKC